MQWVSGSLRAACLAVALFMWLTPGIGHARIDFDWSEATLSISRQTRQRVEALVLEIADEFQEGEFADLGGYDFRNHNRGVLVQVREFGPNRERGLHLTGTIYINQSQLANLEQLRLTLFHEFCHLYDFCALSEMMMEYMFSSESGDARVAQKGFDQRMKVMKRLRFKAEDRAHDKTETYGRRFGLVVREIHP